jgi:hypothetical protein
MDPMEREIEDRKLALEERRIQIEERQARHGFWTRLGIVLPVLVALLVFAGGIVTQRLNARDALSLQEEQAKDDFELKVAEIVMDSESPFGVRNRAIAMGELFPHRLGIKFAHDFDPEHASNTEARLDNQRIAAKKELLKLMVEHPAERRQVVDTWRQLFPDDEWARALE